MKTQYFLHKKNGFTLLELLVVLLIICVTCWLCWPQTVW
ncbi:prepilin-type N-terminal cleavage/methylation domain-containing protein [Deefgea sp. CFH1-16]|nr:prepilin-type N-terminal cleavage/methylation domain-containing protein [Deefgea sp. CFH1-16]